VTDSPLEEAGFEPSVPRQGTAFFTEGNELYPLPINHQVGAHPRFGDSPRVTTPIVSTDLERATHRDRVATRHAG